MFHPLAAGVRCQELGLPQTRGCQRHQDPDGARRGYAGKMFRMDPD
jgi:hypothetical protein